MKNLILTIALVASFSISLRATEPTRVVDHRTQAQKADTTIQAYTTSIIWVPIATRTYYLEVTRLNGDTTTKYRDFLRGSIVQREGYKFEMGQAYKAIKRVDKCIYHGPISEEEKQVRLGSFVGHYDEL
jgi:hypothetical protein